MSAAEQGSAAWLYERCGYVTASRFRDVTDKLKSGKPGAKRQTYLMEVVIERITGNAIGLMKPTSSTIAPVAAS